jgi:hypothetical protein
MLSDDRARDLAMCVGLEWSDADVELLAPLVDAAIVWAEDEQLERIATPIVEAMWEGELREDIERALDRSAEASPHIRKAIRAARKDLAAGPSRSRLARAFLEQAAFELAFAEQEPVHCLLCVEDLLRGVPPGERRPLALRVARIASRAAAVPETELRAAVAKAALGQGPADTAPVVATDARRLAVREWLLRLAELGSKSVPTLAAELHVLVSGPLPPAPHDEVWRETVAGLIGGLVEPWN